VPSLSSDQEIGMLRNLQLLDQIERLEAEKKHEKHENP